jgi:apolipoprotein N-acyltransferase
MNQSTTPHRFSTSPLLRTLAGLGLAAVSALLLTLAFPPYGAWPLIFVGLVPLIVAQHHVVPRPISGLVYGLGVGAFFWGYFHGFFQNGPWFMQALPLGIAALTGLFSLRDAAFHRRTGYRWLVLQGAVTWVGIEMIRGLVPVVGTWGFVGYALYDQPWLTQPVSVFSIYGLDLLILAINYTLALAALAALDRRVGGPTPVPAARPGRWALGVGLVVGAWLGLSLILWTTPTPDLRVAAIQPAFKVASDEGVAQLADLTRQAARQGAELVVWNEGALPFDPRRERTADLRALAAETGTHLVIGYAFETAAGYRNEAVILTPEGQFLGPFGKDHPVAWSGETSITRGPYAAHETALGTLGLIICYDLDFTDTTRRVTRRGAQLVAAPSFDWPAIAHKHHTHLVFRAIENRVAMVKADVAFGSTIVDPYGRILARAVTPGAEQRILVADVALGRRDTLVTRLGDWMGWIGLAGMALFTPWIWVSSLRRLLNPRARRISEAPAS